MSNKYSSKFLQQPFTATNKLRDWCIAAAKQLMIFRRLNILCQVPRIKITASLTFDQKNICSQLKLLASYSEVFDVTWWRKCHKMIRITDLTEKKLRLQIAGTVGNVYVLTRLTHTTYSCCKWLPQRKLRCRPALLHCACPFCSSLVIFTS